MIAVLWLLVGFAAGAAYFVLLHWNTQLYVNGSKRLATIGLQALRLATMGLVLGLAAWYGAMPLLLATSGVILVRSVALRVMQVTT